MNDGSTIHKAIPPGESRSDIDHVLARIKLNPNAAEKHLQQMDEYIRHMRQMREGV